jgi:hypothetical protein
MSELDEARQARSDINRAVLAQQVKDNEIYQQAIMVMLTQCHSDFARCKQGDSEELNKVWLRLNAIKDFQENLESVMDSGKWAEQTLTALEKAKKLIGL